MPHGFSTITDDLSEGCGLSEGGGDESVELMPRLTILVIDDSRFARAIIKNSLCSLSIIKDIIEFGDAVDGLELLRSGNEPIDLVLLDNEMPLLTGKEFTLTVRRDTGFPKPEIPIIMISCCTDQPRVVAARNAGINEFLAKPFCAKDLYQRIRSTILRPRPFIRAKNYVGPDRRWINNKLHGDGQGRRKIVDAPLNALQSKLMA